MLDRFQKEVLSVIAANRNPERYVAGGRALNRGTPRRSADIDVFHKTVALIDDALARDLAVLRSTGYRVERVRETDTMREWVVSGPDGASTKLQWTRDTSWLFSPPFLIQISGMSSPLRTSP